MYTIQQYSNEPCHKYVKPISGYHSIEDNCIMHNVHQMATITQAKLQPRPSTCVVSVGAIH